MVACLPVGRLSWLPACRQAGSAALYIMAMYIIYALKFVSGRIYVGMTSNPEQRLADHRRGHVKSTKNRGEFKILQIENCGDKKLARLREKFWKSGCCKE